MCNFHLIQGIVLKSNTRKAFGLPKLFQLDPRGTETTGWNYYLPPVLISADELATMTPPASLASLVFISPVETIRDFSFRYVYGMHNVFCTEMEPGGLIIPSLQSLSHIIRESLNRISCELQRVLSKRRQNQSSCSVTNLLISILCWKYLVDVLSLPLILKERPLTGTVSWSKDLSIT